MIGLAIVLNHSASWAIVVPVVSTFDAGADGWSADPAQVEPESTGGNPDGYLRHEDEPPAARTDVIAPSSFLGDWSNLDGVGEFRYDHRVIHAGSGSPSGGVPYEVRMTGAGPSSAVWLGAMPGGAGDWTEITVPIDESDWTVETGTWDDLLTDVTSLEIRIELFGGDDISGIDNVRLTCVPAEVIDATCDGVDEDCDGLIDEDCTQLVPAVNATGVTLLAVSLIGASCLAMTRRPRTQ